MLIENNIDGVRAMIESHFGTLGVVAPIFGVLLYFLWKRRKVRNDMNHAFYARKRRNKPRHNFVCIPTVDDNGNVGNIMIRRPPAE